MSTFSRVLVVQRPKALSQTESHQFNRIDFTKERDNNLIFNLNTFTLLRESRPIEFIKRRFWTKSLGAHRNLRFASFTIKSG